MVFSGKLNLAYNDPMKITLADAGCQQSSFWDRGLLIRVIGQKRSSEKWLDLRAQSNFIV